MNKVIEEEVLVQDALKNDLYLPGSFLQLLLKKKFGYIITTILTAVSSSPSANLPHYHLCVNGLMMMKLKNLIGRREINNKEVYKEEAGEISPLFLCPFWYSIYMNR